MRGRYQMMDWEENRWKYIISKAIEKFAEDRDPPYVEDLTQKDICPANIVQAMEMLGWDQASWNGYKHDQWYHFSNPDYDFEIVMYFDTYVFQLKLYRRYRD